MGFEQHGEGGVAGGDGEEVGGAFALLPERGAGLRSAAGQEQSAGGGFAEFRGEEGGGAELADDEVLRGGGIGENEGGVGRRIDVGKTEDEAVVGGHGFDVGSTGGLDLRSGGHGPGRVDAIAKRGEDADAPVTEFVADALDDDVAVIWNGGCYICLVGEELQEVFCGLGIEVVFADEAADGGVGWERAEFADEGADAAAEFEGATGLVTVPEGHFAGLAGSGRDGDSVVGDFIDAPGGGAEDEHFADAGFEDHFFVELADADGFLVLTGEEDAVEAAIGDGSGVEDGERLCAFAGREEVGDAVPGDARAELSEFVGGVLAGEEVENIFEGGAG